MSRTERVGIPEYTQVSIVIFPISGDFDPCLFPLALEDKIRFTDKSCVLLAAKPC